MTDWPAKEKQYYMNTFNRLPVTLVSGDGSWVWDDRGRRYLDFLQGIAVNVLGHAHPVQVKAIAQQATTLLHTSSLFHVPRQYELAELLVENSALDRVFFVNSGSEALETTIKIVRKYGKLHRDGAHEIIVMSEAFHGRTIAAVAATANPHYQEDFVPMPEGFVRVPFNDLAAAQAAVNPKTAGILIELIQGEGGVWEADRDYVQGLRTLCDEHNLLLALDEVQTGIGRTGRLFAYEHYGIQPDVMALAKALGGGLPIGACLVNERAGVFVPGDHGSTFGGNPLVCAGAAAVVRNVIENELWKNAERQGERIKAGLAEISSRHGNAITNIRGMGLLLAFDLGEERAEKFLAHALECGLIVNRVAPPSIRMAPALTLTDAEADEGLARIEKTLVGIL